MNGKRTYVRDLFDIGPECNATLPRRQTSFLRAKVVGDYVDCTTSNLAYLVFSRWARIHVVEVCGRDELPVAALTLIRTRRLSSDQEESQLVNPCALVCPLRTSVSLQWPSSTPPSIRHLFLLMGTDQI